MAKEIIKEDSLYIAKDRKKKIPSTVQYIKKDLIYIAKENNNRNSPLHRIIYHQIWTNWTAVSQRKVVKKSFYEEQNYAQETPIFNGFIYETTLRGKRYM